MNIPIGQPCGPCAPGGWNPGLQSGMRPTLPDRAGGYVNTPFDFCDPKLGLAIRYYPVNSRVALSQPEAAPSAPQPPVLYDPVAEVNAATNPQGWSTIVSHVVPNGFNGLAVSVFASINAQEYSDAVEFAVFATDQQIEGEVWRGSISWPDWRPLMRVATPGNTVSIRARIRREFWTTGATPLRSLIVAEAQMILFCKSIAGPCGPFTTNDLVG